ncbi:MAG: RDD family protein [Bacteroidetes bacterium HGW-Bacteroidetes-15]|nr:MAG: RDD family protein [Bacteroidetes bacterium HGW-Bacteroidetes-15]
MFCKVCKNQKFDPKQGIVCGLTNLRADFEKSCEFFSGDLQLKAQHDLELKKSEVFDKTASTGKRFANYLIDFIFFMIFCFISGVILGIVLVFVSPESLSIFDEENKLVEYLLAFILAMIYYTTFEALTGRTIGKYITKTKVVNQNGDKPDFGTILIRSLCRFIPFDALSFLGSENTGWHDRFSKTFVVEI